MKNEAPWFDDKRSENPKIETGDLVLDRRLGSGKGLTAKLLRK